MLGKINILILVLLLSFFYVPYDSFNIGIKYSFWNVPIWFYMLCFFSILISLVIRRKFSKDTLSVCATMLIFLIGYVTTLFISKAQMAFPLVLSMIVGFVFFGYLLFSFENNKKEKLQLFLTCTFFCYSLSFLIFILMYGVGQYRFVAGGVSSLNPAFLGFVSGFIFLLCIYSLKFKIIYVPHCLALFCGFFAFSTVVLTQTRISLIALFLSLFILCFNRVVHFLFNRKISVLAISIIFLVGLLTACVFYFGEGYLERLNLNRVESLLRFLSFQSHTSGPSPDAGRFNIWLSGLESLDNYYLGQGLGSFLTNHGIAPHNTFLLVFYEMGVIGLITFLIGLLCFMFYALKSRMTFLYIYLVVYGLGNDFLYMPQYYILFSLFFVISLLHLKSSYCSNEKLTCA